MSSLLTIVFGVTTINNEYECHDSVSMDGTTVSNYYCRKLSTPSTVYTLTVYC